MIRSVTRSLYSSYIRDVAVEKVMDGLRSGEFFKTWPLQQRKTVYGTIGYALQGKLSQQGIGKPESQRFTIVFCILSTSYLFYNDGTQDCHTGYSVTDNQSYKQEIFDPTWCSLCPFHSDCTCDTPLVRLLCFDCCLFLDWHSSY